MSWPGLIIVTLCFAGAWLVWESIRRDPAWRAVRSIRQGDAAAAKRDWNAAWEHYAAARELAPQISDERPRCLAAASAAAGLGSVTLVRDEYEEAERYLTEAIELAAELPESEDGFHLGACGNLALVFLEQGKLEEAQSALERLNEASRAPDVNEIPEVAQTLHQIAMAFAVRGFYAYPAKFIRRAIELLRSLDEPPIDQITAMHVDLAKVHVSLAEWTQADEVIERAVRALERHQLGESLWADCLWVRGTLRTIWCDFDVAEAALDEALETYQQLHGPVHATVGSALGSLADLYRVRGDYARGLEFAERALSVNEQSELADRSAIAGDFFRLGMHLTTLGRYEEAADALERALRIEESGRRKLKPALGAILIACGLLELAGLRFADAETALRRSREAGEQVYGKGHRMTADALALLGTALGKQGRYDEAESLLREALAIWDSHPASCRIDRADTLGQLADVLAHSGRVAEAEHLARQALALLTPIIDRPHVSIAFVLTTLGEVCRATGRLPEAEHHLRRALEIRESVQQHDIPEIARILNALADVVRDSGHAEQASALEIRAMQILSHYEERPK